jgi:hypothetical protein
MWQARSFGLQQRAPAQAAGSEGEGGSPGDRVCRLLYSASENTECAFRLRCSLSINVENTFHVSALQAAAHPGCILLSKSSRAAACSADASGTSFTLDHVLYTLALHLAC